MKLPCMVRSAEGKYIAARNALIAKYTLGTLPAEKRTQLDDKILDLLLLSGIRPGRARQYRAMLRETQYFGMAAIAMALLGIRPALLGILYKDRWAQVSNPLVILTAAETEVEIVSQEILEKHGIRLFLSDADKNAWKWERLFGETRKPGDMN